MISEKVLREAVEVADGWENAWGGFSTPLSAFVLNKLSKPHIAALASQLIVQMDALPHYFFDSDLWGTAKVWESIRDGHSRISKANGEVRDHNTINAIIESKVLRA